MTTPRTVSILALLVGLAGTPASAQLTIEYSDGENDTTAYSTSAPNNPLTLNAPSGTATQSGDLTGDGQVVKDGGGSLSLTGTNTFTGGTVLRTGTLRVGSDTLGSGSLEIRNGTTIGNLSADADAFLDNSVSVQGDFTLDVQGSQGSLDLTGAVDFTGAPNATVNLTSDGLACFSGAVNGLNITFQSTNPNARVSFCGPDSNAIIGTVTVGNNVLLELDKDAAATAIAGNLTIQTGGIAALLGSGQFASTSEVVVNGTLVSLLSSDTEIQSLSGGGEIVADLGVFGASELTIRGGTFAGTFREEDGGLIKLIKSGANSLTLTGASSYTGGTSVEGGILRGQNNQAFGTGAITVTSGTLIIVQGFSVANDIILAGGTYERGFSGNLTGSMNARSDLGGVDTYTTILAGTTSLTTLSSSFQKESTALNDAIRLSDVYSFTGTGSNLFVLQLTISGLTSDTFLGWLDGSEWVNAVDGNTGNNATSAMQNFQGSFALFQSTFGTDLSTYVGAWGVSAGGGTTSTWAVLNHNSDFAIVPEPASLTLLALSGLGFLALRRRKA